MPAAEAGGFSGAAGAAGHTGSMPVRLHHIVVDSHDLPELARFWTQALGWKVLSEREREIVIGPDGNAPVGMCFMPVTDPKAVKNRVHLDLTSSAPRRHRVDRRRVLDSTGRPRGERVLRDTPEGNAHPVTLSAGRHRSALSVA
jgi:hypothetical protein